MTTVFPSAQEIKRAAELLRSGALVAFPTETVYGLGADATNEAAVEAIFRAKGRPSNNPLIVHVASFEDLLRCTDLTASNDPQRLRAQLEALKSLWPGPLSVVVPKVPSICQAVSAGGSTVALRIPRHPTALRLITACGGPVAAPSANPSSYISPTTAAHVRESLSDKVAYILDGGACEIGLESTVLSLVANEPVILRPGAITAEQLSALLQCDVQFTATASVPSAPLLSPGLLAKHYSPRTPVRLLDTVDRRDISDKKVGVIVFSSNRRLQFTPHICKVLSERGELHEIAANLFSALHELDTAGINLIIVDTCEPIGLGAAIMDRLLRAARS